MDIYGWLRVDAGIDRFGLRRVVWTVAALLCLAGCSDNKMLTNPNQTTSGMGAAVSGSGGTPAAAGAGAGAATSTGSAGAGAQALATAGRSGANAGGTNGATAGTSGGTSGSAASGGAGSSAIAGMSASAGAGGSLSAGGCTRDNLKATIDAYFKALAAHDPSTLAVGTSVKFTENGKLLMLGEGAWKTAGALKWKRSALDTETCNSVTEAVIPDGSTDIPFGLRLKLQDQKITEVETIAVRSGDYFTASNTMAMIATGSDDWETSLPADQRPTREALTMLIDKYFTQFPAGACNFASDCKRLENGFSPGSCTAGLSCSMSSTGMGSAGMKPRLHVLDTEAGIAAGFVMFAGSYTDFHLFKVRTGMVHGVHAILAKATSSGWE
jgi:hypothetical protein